MEANMTLSTVLSFFNPLTPYERPLPEEDGWSLDHGHLHLAFRTQIRSTDDLLSTAMVEGLDPSGNYMTAIRAAIALGNIRNYTGLVHFIRHLPPDFGRVAHRDAFLCSMNINQKFGETYQTVFDKENERRRLRNSFVEMLTGKDPQVKEGRNFFVELGKIGQIAGNILFFPTDCFHVKRMPLVKSIAASYCITTIVEAVFPWALIPIALLPTCNMLIFLFKTEVTFATGSWLAGYGFRLITPSNMIGLCRYLLNT